ncbi:MAG: hypothetical protein E6J07_01450 [Chloroflexi bacterium]|nr:MAG: hypothetical protein E6J07_01450 [Chloroflexota bacterium]
MSIAAIALCASGLVVASAALDVLVEGGVRAAFQLRSLLAQVGESHAITLVGAPDGGGWVDGAGGRLAETAGCRLDGGGERARGRERDW